MSPHLFGKYALLALLALSFGCSSLRELAPETAARRISSSDGYKHEACLLMQEYVTLLEEFDWMKPRTGARLPGPDLANTAAIFVYRPQVTCRVKAGKSLYDLDGKSFFELVRVLQVAHWLQQKGVSLPDCEDCRFSDIGLSNGLLLAYFKRAPFPALRESAATAYEHACLAAGEGELPAPASISSGAWNPLHESREPCTQVLLRKLDEQSGRCGRYGTMPYLVCPTGVWSTATSPARPIHYLPDGYGEYRAFHGGFVLVRKGGSEIFWRRTADELGHDDATGEVTLSDIDGNGYLDAGAAGLLYLSRRDGTVERVSAAAFNARNAAATAAAVQAHERAQLLRLPLDKLEALLTSTHLRDPDLLQAAAEKSLQWWHEADYLGVAERIEIYWHAKLWDTVAGRQAVDDRYYHALRNTIAPPKLKQRQEALRAARASGDAQTLFEGCKTLRADSAALLQDLQHAIDGTRLAERNIGHAWEQYSGRSIPAGELQQAYADAQRNDEDLQRFLNGVCL